MLQDHPTSFHPYRGIRQGNTPSTLIFIVVFDILLTLLEESGTEDAHAYADDLAHLAESLAAQQTQADLVCGFVAYLYENRDLSPKGGGSMSFQFLDHIRYPLADIARLGLERPPDTVF